jgi:hypothetical protein
MPSFWESIKVDGADMRLYVSVPRTLINSFIPQEAS